MIVTDCTLTSLFINSVLSLVHHCKAHASVYFHSLYLYVITTIQ